MFSKQYTRVITILLIAIIIPTACKENKRFEVTSEARLNLFITGMSLDYLSTIKSLNAQKYKLLTGKANSYNSALLKLRRIVFSEENRQTVSSWYANMERISDPYLKRQVKILANFFLINSVEASPAIDELRTKITGDFLMLKYPATEGDLSLHGMYRLLAIASGGNDDIYRNIVAEKGKIKNDTLSLITERNDRASSTGFDGFAPLAFKVENIKTEFLEDLLKRLDAATRTSYRVYLEELDNTPVRYTDLFRYFNLQPSFDSNQMEKSLDKVLDEMGFQHRGRIKYEVNELSTSSSGFTVAVPGSYRFVITQPEGSFEYLDDFLNQYLTGVYYANLIDTKVLLTGFSEAPGARSRVFNIVFREIMKELTLRAPGMSEFKRLYDSRERKIYRFRKLLFKAAFEYGIYKYQDADPDNLYTRLMEKYLLASLPAGVEADWMLDHNLADKPLSYSVKLVGLVASRQMIAALDAKLPPGETSPAEYGAWIRNNLIGRGELYTWEQKLRDTTAANLNITDFVEWILK